MGNINLNRLILGGIVAGIVGDVLGYLVDGVLLASRWADGMQALGKTEFSMGQNVLFNLIGLIYGILIVWLYAAIRPRYGAGPRTAVYAGLAIWIAGVLLPNIAFMWVIGLFGRRLALLTTTGGIVELVIAALAGAALYQERAQSMGSLSARA